MVVSRDVGVGKVFSTMFAPDKDVGFHLAVAGSKGAMQIWDTSTNGAVRRTIAGKEGVELGEEVPEKMTKLAEDDTDSDSEEGEDGEGDDAGDGWEDEDDEAMEE